MTNDVLEVFKRDTTKLLDEYIIIESEQAIKLFLENGGEVVYLIKEENFKPKINVDHLTSYDFSRKFLSQYFGFRFHVGLMALAKKPIEVSLNEMGPRIAVLNGITGPENIGSIARACAAFGFNSLLIDSDTASPYLKRCIRVSTGNIFYLNIHSTPSLCSSLNQLKMMGFQIIGCEIDDTAQSLYQFVPEEKLAVIFGSEGAGIAPSLLELCDHKIQVPQMPHFSSLNVSHCAAIVLSQLFFKSGNKIGHL